MGVEITGLGTMTLLSSTLRSNQSTLSDLTQQLSSQQKSQTLAGYAVDGRRLLDLKSASDAAGTYVKSADTVTTFLNGYDNTLGDLASVANQLNDALTKLPTLAASDNLPAAFKSLVPGLATDASATLNTQLGGRYLFAGTRYGTSPVQDLSTLPALTTPAAFSAVTSPALADYDTQTGNNAQAWSQATVTIADRQQMSFGASSNDPSVQKLVFALRNATAALTASEPDRSQYLSLAKDAANQAFGGLKDLQSSNAIKLAQVDTVQKDQKQAQNTLTGLVGNITQIDQTDVAARIAALQTQIEASYQATSKLLDLSLTKYLG